MKERVSKWDNVKFILIMCVVIGHVSGPYMTESRFLSGLTFFIYLFHIPAFFFVSGLLAKKTIRERRYEKLFPYLILFLFSEFLIFSFSSVIYHNYSIHLLKEGGLPWFVLSLFIMNMITIWVQNIKPAWVIGVSLVLSFFIGFCAIPEDTLAYMRTINFYIFFYLGYLIDPQVLMKKTRSIKVKVVSFFVLSAVIGGSMMYSSKLSEIRLLLSGRNPYKTLGEWEPYGGIMRLGVSLVTLIIIFAIIGITPNWKSFFTKVGQKTLAIYTFHYCLFYILFRVFDLKGIVQDAIPVGWPYVLVLIGVVMAIVCANPMFDKIVKGIMDSNNKLQKRLEK